MWCWYGFTKCDKSTVKCDVDTAEYDNGTIKCEKKRTTKYDKNTVKCDVGIVEYDNRTIKCEKKKGITKYDKRIVTCMVVNIVSYVKGSISYRRIVSIHESYDILCVSYESYRIVS